MIRYVVLLFARARACVDGRGVFRFHALGSAVAVDVLTFVCTVGALLPFCIRYRRDYGRIFCLCAVDPSVLRDAYPRFAKGR